MTTETPLTFAEKKEFLGQLEIFRELDDEELIGLTLISEQFAFSQGALIIHQRDAADKLYIVRSGRLEAFSVDDNGVAKRELQYLPGSYFQDVWLFKPGAHPASIRTRTNGRLITIDSSKLLKFLDKNKQVLNKLILSDAAELEVTKSRLGKPEGRYRVIKLVPDEFVELETRRSAWVFIAKAFLPFLFMILLPLLIYSSLRPSDPFATFNSRPLVISLIPGVILALVVLFFWLDWANDYLIITNKRLVHYEFNLTTFSGKSQDTPIDQVQSVVIVTPNIFSTILGLGTAQVTTAAQTSVLYFDYIHNPRRVEETLDRIRQRSRTLDEGRAQVNMRQSVENYFKIPPPLVKLADEKYVPPPPPPIVATWVDFNKWLARVSQPYRYRVEEGNTITYRKHLFVLLTQLLWPLIFTALLLLVVFLLGSAGVGAYFWFIAIAALLDIAWLIWRIEDWRNDIFQLTDRYIFDIDRRPFGFGESRKQAQLDNVQNVNAEQPNILTKIFNFGHVHIETAGKQANIIFENVSHPAKVQNDIFKRREKFRELQRVQAAERQRKEYAVLLDVYIQESELDRVRRRTPDLASVSDEQSAETATEVYESSSDLDSPSENYEL